MSLRSQEVDTHGLLMGSLSDRWQPWSLQERASLSCWCVVVGVLSGEKRPAERALNRGSGHPLLLPHTRERPVQGI